MLYTLVRAVQDPPLHRRTGIREWICMENIIKGSHINSTIESQLKFLVPRNRSVCWSILRLQIVPCSWDVWVFFVLPLAVSLWYTVCHLKRRHILKTCDAVVRVWRHIAMNTRKPTGRRRDWCAHCPDNSTQWYLTGHRIAMYFHPRSTYPSPYRSSTFTFFETRKLELRLPSYSHFVRHTVSRGEETWSCVVVVRFARIYLRKNLR